MTPIQAFEQHVKDYRIRALTTVDARVDAAVAKMQVIPPGQGVVDKTMGLYPVKCLPPFDEMVLGAVMLQAHQLFEAGSRDLYFCNANAKDFSPTTGNTLGSAYASCGLKYLADFEVPQNLGGS